MGTVTKLSERLIHQFGQLKNSRYNFDSYWRDVTRVCCPDYDQFYQSPSGTTQGEKRFQYQYDATASQAVEYYTSIQESMTMPRGQKYHMLSAREAAIADDYDARTFFDDLNDTLFKERYTPATNFQPALRQTLRSYSLFGNGVLYIDRRGESNRYKSCFIGDCYFVANFQGAIDGIFRKFAFTHEQAVQMFGKNAPADVRKMLEANPRAKEDYIHVVIPNDDYDPRSILPEKRRFIEVYIHEKSQEELEVSGYDSFPYAVARSTVFPNEIYGRSPAMQMLPHIMVLQEMSRLDLKGWELERLPPLLASDFADLGGGRLKIDMRPGAINWGGIDEQGRQTIQPLNAAGRMTPIGDKRMEQERAAIRSAFFVDLYQVLVQTPTMTATEAMIRAQEKAGLLVPAIGPLQDTFIGGIISREIDILENAGLVPEVPQSLSQVAETGELDIEVVYDAPINRLAKSEEIEGMRAMIEDAVQHDTIMGRPDALLNLDMEFYQREAAKQRGVPNRFVKRPEEIAQRKQREQQEQQAAQLSAGAPQIAKATKDFAQAQAIAQQAGQ